MRDELKRRSWHRGNVGVETDGYDIVQAGRRPAIAAAAQKAAYGASAPRVLSLTDGRLRPDGVLD